MSTRLPVKSDGRKKDGRRNNGGLNEWIPTANEIRQIEEFAKLALPIRYMCALLNITNPTFYKALRENNKIALALAKGRAQLGLSLHAKTVHIARNLERDVDEIVNTKEGPFVIQVRKKEYSGNVEAEMIKFMLKHLEGWRDDWTGLEEESDVSADPKANEANLPKLREQARRLNQQPK